MSQLLEIKKKQQTTPSSRAASKTAAAHRGSPPKTVAGATAVRSRDLEARGPRFVRQAESDDAYEEPGDVCGRGRRRDHDGFSARDIVDRRAGNRVFSPDRAVALVHRAVRQFRRGDGGSAGQGAGRYASKDQDRNAWRSGSWDAIGPKWFPLRSSGPATWCLSRRVT